MADKISPEKRAAVLASIRRKGNRSTKAAVEAALLAAGITNWEKHRADVLGSPDFYFPNAKLALFVDGCFWHLCPRCGRPPSRDLPYWITKLEGNRRRDNRTRRKLWCLRRSLLIRQRVGRVVGARRGQGRPHRRRRGHTPPRARAQFLRASHGSHAV